MYIMIHCPCIEIARIVMDILKRHGARIEGDWEKLVDHIIRDGFYIGIDLDDYEWVYNFDSLDPDDYVFEYTNDLEEILVQKGWLK